MTKDGEDPLLSSEENCPEIVGPPTESEMNSAITGNVGRILAVMKAVNRFKDLIDKRNGSDIMGSILGQEGKFVSPPGTILKDYARASAGKVDAMLPDISSETAKQKLQSRGDSIGTMLAGKIDKLPQHVKTAVFTDSKADGTPNETLRSPDEPPAGHALRKTQSSPFPIHYDQAKGRAHDPLDDRLFLHIGANPQNEASQSDNTFILSESPPAAGFHIFEEAYNEEVHDIMRRRRHHTTVYLTRRVEDAARAKATNAKANAGLIGANLSDTTTSNFASLVGKAVGGAQANPTIAKAASAAKDWTKSATSKDTSS